MSAGHVTVIIDDQIRDEHFTQRLDARLTVASIIEWLIDQLGLPHHNIAGNTIDYDLIRSQTGQVLPLDVTLQQTGVLDGEELQLVSPEARLIWKLIEKLKEEIRNYIQLEFRLFTVLSAKLQYLIKQQAQHV